MIRVLRDQGVRREEIRAFHHGLEELRARVEATGAAPAEVPEVGGEIGPGQWVRVRELDREGKVLTAVSSHGTVEVQLRMGRVRLPITAVSRAGSPQESRGDVPLFVDREESISPEINLLGSTVEEATRRLEKYLDAAFLWGLRHVRVIHGKGTGVLRKGVHKFLRGHPLVEGFDLAEMTDGGSGATVVALKDR